MAPREPTRAQLSSKLAYQQHTPTFLLKLQNRMNGIPDEEEEPEDDDDNNNNGEFEYVGSGRPPIPKRPAIPERPKDEPGSADEEDDGDDEKPQVVVLKAGKHLTEREAENVRRKEKGLPPLPEPKADNPTTSKLEESSASSKKSGSNQTLSFSSSSSKSNFKSNNNKRKAIGQLDELKDGVMKAKSKTNNTDNFSKSSAASVKKAKKSNKTLLSFGDDDT